MVQNTVFLFAFVLCIHYSESSFIFHEGTKIIFQPEYDAEYFGFSTLLTPEELLVGAPKSRDVVSKIKPGVVFRCPLHNLYVKHVNCTAMRIDSRVVYKHVLNKDVQYRVGDDMWLGATMVSLSNGRLLINAPRWMSPSGNNEIRIKGASLIQIEQKSTFISSLNDNNLFYVSDGKRKEYKGNRLNFHAFGQAGMSATVTKRNTVILGTPGLLEWTGGIVTMSFDPNATNSYMTKLPIPNPYFTKELGPDVYFGYSVDSGIFTKNGTVHYVASAPRSNMGSGLVLVFEPPDDEEESLSIKAKIRGPQSGSYFGASLCCTDLNGDGVDDLLVGAPTFVKNDGGLPYDQGAVFVYLTKEQGSEFSFEEYGHVSGSTTNGAWFGISIADLGDVNGDGFRDVAIGAPWEDDGIGAVYVYKGCTVGLNINNVHRIQPEGAKGFGWSIAKGVDVDKNNCNDLAIGAHNSQTTYIYRCIPTIRVYPVIEVPNASNLPQNTTRFTANFCVVAPPNKALSLLEINIIIKIKIDSEFNRAALSGNSTYTRRVKPGDRICDEQTIEVHPTANLNKPITLILQLEPEELMKENSTTFLKNAARLEESSLKTSFLVQLLKNCGKNVICVPWLVMTLDAFDNPYIPGSNTTLGIRIKILNEEEPAYGASVNINLPMAPKRIPDQCYLRDLNMTCNIPTLLRGEDVIWEIELNYHINQKLSDTDDSVLNVEVELKDPLYRNITNDAVKKIDIHVTPEANITVSGKAMLNASMAVSRDTLSAGANLSFKHFFQITNFGPSDWSKLIAHILIPERTNLLTNIDGCVNSNNTDVEVSNIYKCVWSLRAKTTLQVFVPLQMDLNKEGNYLMENGTYNAITTIVVRRKHDNTTYSVTMTLILDPEDITWKIILASVILGLLLLALIVWILHKTGFFQRKKLLKSHTSKQSLIEEDIAMSSQNDGCDDNDTPMTDVEPSSAS